MPPLYERHLPHRFRAPEKAPQYDKTTVFPAGMKHGAFHLMPRYEQHKTGAVGDSDDEGC